MVGVQQVLGTLVEALILRRLTDRPLAQVLVTLGIAFVIADLCLTFWSGDPMQLQAPRALSDAEQRIYDLVVRRFLSVFFPPAEYLVTTRITEVERFGSKMGLLTALAEAGARGMPDALVAVEPEPPVTSFDPAAPAAAHHVIEPDDSDAPPVSYGWPTSVDAAALPPSPHPQYATPPAAPPQYAVPAVAGTKVRCAHRTLRVHGLSRPEGVAVDEGLVQRCCFCPHDPVLGCAKAGPTAKRMATSRAAAPEVVTRSRRHS